MIFSEERYEQIENLVKRYQGGECEEAGNQLIEMFAPLFNKYIKIIKKGVLDFSDYESRHFISLFIADQKVRAGLKRHFQSKKTREVAYKALYIINSAHNQIFEEDLYHDFIVIFLKSVHKYKVDKGFCAYIAASFPYEVSRLVKKVLQNPISTAVIGDFDDELFKTVAKSSCNVVNLDEKLVSNNTEELSNSWIYGLTCGDPFEDLLPLERLILKLYYLDNMTETEIANKLGFHRNSIWLKRRAAVEKVMIKARQLGLLSEANEQKS